MATLVAALRGDNTDLRYAGGYATGSKLNSSFVTVTANSTPLSGAFIDLTDTTHVKAVSWDGVKNTPNSRSISVLLRFAPTYSGAPAARRQLWNLSAGFGNTMGEFELAHESVSGNVLLQCKNETGAVSFNAVNLGAWLTNVSGTFYDFLFQWDGTTTANAAKLYIDNVLVGSGATAAFAVSATLDNNYYKSIALGAGMLSGASALKVDEFCLWDGAQDPANCALVSGNGALNGASRTSLVNAAAFVGGTYTDPGVANVRVGTTYVFAGSTNIGAYVAAFPTAAEIAACVWDSSVVEGTLTTRQAMKLNVAAMAGKLSGAATTSVVVRDTLDTKNRISATVDASGNRTAVTYDVT